MDVQTKVKNGMSSPTPLPTQTAKTSKPSSVPARSSASAAFVETEPSDIPAVQPPEDEAKINLSFAVGLPDILCNDKWLGGCGTSNLSTLLRCSGCSHRLWSGVTSSGGRMRLGQSCAFFRAKSGILEDGIVIRISDDGERISVKVNLPYCNHKLDWNDHGQYVGYYSDDRYDEEHPLRNVFNSKEEANQGKGRRVRSRPESFTFSIDTKTPTKRVAKDPEDEIKEGDEVIVCSKEWGGCGKKNLVKYMTCSGCPHLIWTTPNKVGESFYLGQVCVLLRPKDRIVYDITITRIFDSKETTSKDCEVRVKVMALYSFGINSNVIIYIVHGSLLGRQI